MSTHPPFVAHDPKHIDPETPHPRRAALATVPDLRFEYGFLKSVQPYFRLVPWKGKEKEPSRMQPSEQLEIQWLQVGWVTLRDQVLSPLAQGALWAIAAHLLSPFYGQARSFIPHPPEGGFAKWLRGIVQPFRTPTRSRT